MANIDFPRGFWLLDGEKYTFAEYEVSGGVAATVAPGDAVSQTNDGYVNKSAANDGDIVVGVVSSVFNSSRIPVKYLPVSTAGFVQVALALPGTKFGVQSDGAANTKSSIGQTANHVDGSADTYRGISIQELDDSDLGTGQQMRVIDKVNRIDNDWGANADLIVTFVESVFQNNTSI